VSLLKVFDIAGSGMNAQSVRLNTIASNMANAESVAASPDQAYHARQPVFAAIMEQQINGDSAVGVRVEGITQSQAPIEKQYAPDNPLADQDGYIYKSNVNLAEEMANMISASRSYQSNAELINTSKQLLLRTLSLGQ